MKLFYTCPSCKKKVYIASNAKTRRELMHLWGQIFVSMCVHCNGLCKVSPNTVMAEKANVLTVLTTTLTGGAVGIIAGPLGIGIGLAIGGLTASQLNASAAKEVERFNRS